MSSNVLKMGDHKACSEMLIESSTIVESKIVESSITSILEALGEDLDRDGLRDTPSRVSKSLQFLTKGYAENPFKVVNDALFESDTKDMVVIRNIEFFSLCEHHMLPFFGICHIGYLPFGKILGLSKFPRIIDIFARRLQVQEHLTKQIAECIMEVTQARGVAVWVEARHLCMMTRGVEKQLSETITLAKLGLFQDDSILHDQFMGMIRKSN